MRFVQPNQPLPESKTGERLVRPQGKPEWFRKWLENKGRYVQLKCGCKEDLNSKGLLVIGLTFPQSEILCERHNAWMPIARAVRFTEYAEIPPLESPEEPLF